MKSDIYFVGLLIMSFIISVLNKDLILALGAIFCCVIFWVIALYKESKEQSDE
jgi:uncharacterized membrane protein